MAKKSKAFATVEDLKVGDTIWVSSKMFYKDELETTVHPEIVGEVNKTSFYTGFKDGRDPKLYRYNMKTGRRHNIFFGDNSKAYRTKEEFDEVMKLIAERKKLNSQIEKAVKRLTLEQTRSLKEFLVEQGFVFVEDTEETKE